MSEHREWSTEDYFEMIRRHMWLILLPAILVPIATYLVSLKIPNRYTSRTLILVDQQKVPDSFVKPVVTEDLTGRLATMQEQILSRTRLQPIIEHFGLFRGENIPMEEKVEQARKAIKVEPVRSLIRTQAGELPGFYVSFTSDKAQIAQQVCGEITSMFMSENLRAREQSAQGTTDFLRSQLEDAKRNLDEQDAKLASFKQRYIGQLPGQEEMNFTLLNSVKSQLEAATQSLSRSEQDKTYTESLLAQQVAARRSAGTTNPETMEQQLATLQSNLVRLEATYTPEHPDVVKVRADVAALKAKLQQQEPAASVDKTAKTPASEPLSIQQLRAQIRSLDIEIKNKKQEQDRLQKQLQTYQARLQLSPKIEEEAKKLTRDYQTALQFYNELLAKKTQSEMATDLEKKQQGEQFRVMDPPNLPEKPTFPDRPLFALGGLGGGLILGFGLAFVLELRDKSIRNEKDVEFYLQLPTLGLIPSLELAGVNGHKHKKSRTFKRNRQAEEDKRALEA
jgi:protein tyrosine kinase modulator